MRWDGSRDAEFECEVEMGREESKSVSSRVARSQL